jgi:hypothetical protein
MKRVQLSVFASLLATILLPAVSHAQEGRYGLFNVLDSRSKYGQNWFPEPLNTDEMDADQELRLNYSHFEGDGVRSDEVSGEVEMRFGDQGLLTLELEVPWEHESERSDGVTDNADGFGPFEISARHPFFQFVSNDGWFDYTLGGNAELAIASGSDVSKNSEVVAGLFQTIGFGEHLNLQTRVAYSRLLGPGDANGESVLEYAGVLGYNVELPEPFFRVTPMFEIDGETGLNHGESGTTVLDGVVGFDLCFDAIKVGQPKLLLGYVFPLNDNARDEFDWGIVCSALIEF